MGALLGVAASQILLAALERQIECAKRAGIDAAKLQACVGDQADDRGIHEATEQTCAEDRKPFRLRGVEEAARYADP